jgi:hypothetical protein
MSKLESEPLNRSVEAHSQSNNKISTIRQITLQIYKHNTSHNRC